VDDVAVGDSSLNAASIDFSEPGPKTDANSAGPSAPIVSSYVDKYPDLIELPPVPRYDDYIPGFIPIIPPPVT
jgi:hypothetical protein